MILMIENDEDDRLLTKENFQQDWPEAITEFVSSVELSGRLRREGDRPTLILLSMHAQPYSGIDLIRQIRSEKGYAITPIVVLSESALTEEIQASYAAGANSFIKKPSEYGETILKIKAFIDYWGKTVELPA